MSKIKNPEGVHVDEFVGVGWGGQARPSNQHYLDSSTNHLLGGKDKAVIQRLHDEGLTGVRVREFRPIFEV
ncbi:MAG: hypothetical protein IAG10_10325 [Planctomycetaceae bacterium]|nr:hypothetical protein [Planctomycetaceae bacterium]